MNIVPRPLTASIGSMPCAPVVRSQTVAAERSTPRTAAVGCAGKSQAGSGAALAAVAVPPDARTPRSPTRQTKRPLTR